MIVFPNCKINIGLDILRRRADGYHDIESLMVPVEWTDVLEIVPSTSDSTRLFTSGRPVECPPEKNLVMKAYRALNLRVELPPLDIYLNKIIPDGAGLGGGSADAAFTVTAINSLLELDLPAATLAEVASEIGADCPFFVYNRPMMVSGIGTEMTPVDVPQLSGMSIIIVKPQTGVSTKEAYAGVTPREPSTPLAEIIKLPVEEWQGRVVNAFEPSVAAKCPEIAAIKQRLLECPEVVYASMSGSGSAVYGLSRSDKLADFADVFPAQYDIFTGRLG